MTLDEFVHAFAEEFDTTPVDGKISSKTDYKKLEGWGSLTALSIIAMVDDQCGKTITGADLRSCVTVEEVYNLIESK